MPHRKVYIVIGAHTVFGKNTVEKLIARTNTRVYGVCSIMEHSRISASDHYVEVQLAEEDDKGLEELILRITEKGRKKISGVVFAHTPHLPPRHHLLDTRGGSKTMMRFVMHHVICLHMLIEKTAKYMVENGGYAVIAPTKEDKGDSESDPYYHLMNLQKAVGRAFREEKFFHDHSLKISRYSISLQSVESLGAEYCNDISHRVIHNFEHGIQSDERIV